MVQRGDMVPLHLPNGKIRMFRLELTFLYHGDRYGVLSPRMRLFGGRALIARSVHPCQEEEYFLPLPAQQQASLLAYLQS